MGSSSGTQRWRCWPVPSTSMRNRWTMVYIEESRFGALPSVAVCMRANIPVESPLNHCIPFMGRARGGW